jgi:GNAT superfamily N-acetyltransferase
MTQRRATIRPATADDVDAVSALARLLATTFAFEDDAFRAAFDRLNERDDVRLLVAVRSDHVVIGYLLGFVHDAFFANGPVAWIEEMCVSEPQRRRGVGRALEEEFALWAKDRGTKLIALATRRAASFYATLGYEDSATYFRRIL